MAQFIKYKDVTLTVPNGTNGMIDLPLTTSQIPLQVAVKGGWIAGFICSDETTWNERKARIWTNSGSNGIAYANNTTLAARIWYFDI